MVVVVVDGVVVFSVVVEEESKNITWEVTFFISSVVLAILIRSAKSLKAVVDDSVVLINVSGVRASSSSRGALPKVFPVEV